MTSGLEIRIEKARILREAGHDPYHPARFNRTDYVSGLKSKYDSANSQEQSAEEVAIGGRVTAIRNMGKSLFLNIEDQTGSIQVYVRKDQLGDDSYKLLKGCLDIGDWLGVNGNVMRTKSGELSLATQSYRFLTKAIRPLPLGKESETGTYNRLEDPEIIYRQPEVGMATDRVRFETLRKRARIIRAVRENLWNKGFDETDTPVIETVYGGANARPFTTEVNALGGLKTFLRISLELPLKRLIAGGFDGVFHLGHVFRNEGIDRNHNPEFSLLEVYKAMWDYNDIMNLTEEIIVDAAEKVNGTTEVRYGSQKIDLARPWRRITMKQSLEEFAGLNVDSKNTVELQAIAAKHNADILQKAGISLDTTDADLVEKVLAYNQGLAGKEGKIPLDVPRGNLIAYLFEELVESKLINPTFVTDHPKETSPLCKLHRDNPELIERFELYANGWELANAYSELNDPVLQRQLLEGQAAELRSGNDEAMPFDEAFVRAIEYGMPTTGGLGIGIDRLVMLLTAKDWTEDSPPTIRDVIFFPLMKPENY
ncbi:MAG: lysine--tRNA ligase [Candidatus Nanoarchaeia archaeon]